VDNNESFLRRGRVAPKRRHLNRTGRLIAAGSASIAVALLAVRFLGGSLFALERFHISGNERARTADILATLNTFQGRNLVTLGLAGVADRLAENPWINSVTLAKRFPDGLDVRVVERRPVALVLGEGRLAWLDATGRTIAPYDPRSDQAEYVVIRGEARQLPELVLLLEDLRARRPEYVAALSEISVLPDGGFGMMDSIFRRPVRVLRRDASEKIGALLAARPLLESRGWEAQAIDLRFADRIVFVGAYGAGHSL
jgi:cell division septal protein FtsQ